MIKIIWPELNSNSICIFVRHIQILNLSWRCATVVEIMIWKWIFNFFLSSRGLTLSKNHPTGAKFKLDLYFSFKISYIWNISFIYVSLQKLKSENWEFLLFFQGWRGITLSKIIRPEPNSHSIWIYLWHIHIWNLSWMCATFVEILIGKWMMTEWQMDRMMKVRNDRTG